MDRLYVIPQQMTLALPEGGLRLRSGKCLKQVDIAYETYGELNAARSNAVLICTPLTMDAHAAGWYSDEDSSPGWWDNMIGPGKPLDTAQYHVITTNVLGGCRGTTGPSSLNPDTGKPYGSLFPKISLEDMVNAQAMFIEQLGISSLAAVIGGSMGGMLALQWSTAFPNRVKKCICIAAGTRLSPQALGFEIIGRKIIARDEHLAGGDYYNTENKPSRGLALARMIGLLTYLSADSMSDKFGRHRNEFLEKNGFETNFEVENYLDYNAVKFTERFDANSYLHITYAMDNFDLETSHGSISKAFENAQAEFLIIALSSDWLFPPEQSRDLTRHLLNHGRIVSFTELDSQYGHDAFLQEVDHLGDVICSFMSHTTPKSTSQAAHRDPATASSGIKASDYLFHVKELIEPGSHILDIGSGDGSLIDFLYHLNGTTGFGTDISIENITHCFRKNVPVIHGDVDNGLSLFKDRSFDYAVMSQTIQMLRKPDFVLKEILRVAKYGIIVFPNFGCIHNRLQLAFTGKMPVSESLPFNWWETPNIHFFTFSDFISLCRELDFVIEKVIPISGSRLSSLCLRLGRINLGADVVIAKISGK